MNFGLSTPVELTTRLTRAEVIDRLTRSVDEPGWLYSFFGAFGLVGRVGQDGCWFENGSFLRRVARRLRLRYEDAADGTVLRGAFVFPAIHLIPLMIFFSISGLIGLLALMQLFSHRGGDWRVVLLTFGVPLAGLAVIRFNLWMARGPERELVETLTEILKGASHWVDGVNPFEGEIVIRPKVGEPRVGSGR
jgi:hypothetical protein